jgi:hypothetical protein
MINELEEAGFTKSTRFRSSSGNMFFTKEGLEFRLCFMCNFFALLRKDGHPHQKYKIRLNTSTIEDANKLFEQIKKDTSDAFSW